MNRKRILITGATGFIGSYLAAHYVDAGYEVISILHDDHPICSSKMIDIHDDVTWCRGDILDELFVRRVVADYEIDEIINAAAMPIERVGYRTTLPVLYTNIFGAANIMEAAKEQTYNGFDIKVLYFSSDKAYGELGNVTLEETMSAKPNSMYTCSKACADLVSKAYGEAFNIPTVITRTCNVYGFGDINSRVIPNTILTCMRNENPIIYKNLNNVREYIHILDVVEAVKSIMDNLSYDSNIVETYNIGSGVIKTQEECVLEILKHFPNNSPIYLDPDNYALKEIIFQHLNLSKIESKFRWKAKISFEDGIYATILEYKRLLGNFANDRNNT